MNVDAEVIVIGAGPAGLTAAYCLSKEMPSVLVFTRTKQWARRLQKEIMMYKGGVTRFTSVLGGDVPRALAKLDAMAGSLEAYSTLSATSSPK